MDDSGTRLFGDKQTVDLGQFATGAADGLMSEAAVKAAQAWIPSRIASYRILRVLGQGGMGTVYEAEQERPHRRVALKVIRPGFATPESLHRFEQEAQALARLHHPGIAQVFEVGTARTAFGLQPYFAMELVEGASLGRYAESAQLGMRAKLELTIRICEAVHHAHQRGIIHRDLKPGNILIGEDGQPKILDFGVARITDAEAQTRQTGVGQLVGTLAYMSPEQVLADPAEIDIRTDVYALGVILYELLAGKRPYCTDQTMTEALRCVCEAEAPPLGTLGRQYRGDVETIVGHALEKDKTRRYSSAAELASDLRRYLDDEPIVARAPSAAYHLRKFAKRHKAMCVAIASIFVVVAAAGIASTHEALRATRAEQIALAERDRAVRAEHERRLERDRAAAAEKLAEQARDRAVAAEAAARADRDRAVLEKRRADIAASTAIAINDFLRHDLLAQSSVHRHASATTEADPDIKVRDVLERAATRIGGKFSGKPSIEAAIRNTIGSTYRDLGLYAQAESQLQDALALQLKATGPEDKQAVAIAASLGDVYRLRGKRAEARRVLEEALGRSSRINGPEADDTLSLMTSLGDLHKDLGDHRTAEGYYRRVLSVRTRRDGADHPGALAAINDLGILAWSEKRYGEAETLLRRAMEGRTRVLGPEHPATMDSVGSMGTLYWERNRLAEAAPLFARAAEVRRQILGPEHPDTLTAIGNLGALHWKAGNYAEAERMWTEAATVSERVLGPNHVSTLVNFNNLAELYRTQKKLGDAEELYKRVLEGFRRSLGEEHPRTVVSMKNLALVYQDQKRFDEAGALLTRVLDIRVKKAGRRHQDTAIAAGWLGGLRMQQERYAEAEALLREALAVWENAAPDDPRRYLVQVNLAASLAAQRKHADAEALLPGAAEGLQRQEGKLPAYVRPEFQVAAERLIAIYRRSGNVDKVTEWQLRIQQLAK